MHDDAGGGGPGQTGAGGRRSGVVFGDIGTSPIYALQTLFSPNNSHPVPLTQDNVYGVVSLIVWSATLIVTVTYVLLAMRVDNDGEGGIMALITLIRRWSAEHHTPTLALLAGLGLFGAALFLGDSMITPAVSVLSAVEGIETVDPGLANWVVPITATVLLLLFCAQRFGSAVVGRWFGPVMLLWFAVLAVMGVAGIVREPGILRALSPTYAAGFFFGHFEIGFFALAAVVLAVTGAEALYADMGHFGRRPITIGWLFVVFPACALNYLGQGALVLDDTKNIAAPFFELVPSWGTVPLVVLATLATVIASQAVISGAFSIASQAAHLGYLPRLRIVHTSTATYGQIYVPFINWLLLPSVLVLVFAFGSSERLANAYGMSVTGTITITTVLLGYVIWRTWRVPRPLLLVGAVILLGVDLLFLAANLTKLVHGAWVPLVIALLTFVVMATWQRGRELVTASRVAMEGTLSEFVHSLADRRDQVTTVPGTAIFLNRGSDSAPLALRANIERNRVRHRHIAIVCVEVDPIPRVAPADRVHVQHLGDRHDGIIRITLRYGYAEHQDIPATLATISARRTEGRLDLAAATYFLSHIEVVPGDPSRMPRWQARLFVATSHITADAAHHFGLPGDRTVVLGARLEL